MNLTKEYYPNLDVMRYIMALGVMVAHFNTLCGFDIPFIINSFDCVGGFFVLSGFLMYPSYCKAKNLRVYVLHRAIRIMPPYAFAVIVFAIGLFSVSTLPITEYFTSSDFWKYLAANLSFLNWLHPNLPGVFDGSEWQMQAVNGSLWTMKVEWCLYFSVPICFWLVYKLKCKKELMASCFIILSWAYRCLFIYLFINTEKEIYQILGRQFFGQLSFFYCGMLAYFYRDYIKQHCLSVFIISLPFFIFYKYVPFADIIIAPVAVTGIVFSIGLSKYSIPWLQHSNNISYNLYLLHFPVFQLCVYFGINTLSAWQAFGMATLSTIIIAYIGNRLVDRPIYNLKRHIR